MEEIDQEFLWQEQKDLADSLGGVGAVRKDQQGRVFFPGSLTATLAARLLPEDWNKLTGSRFYEGIQDTLDIHGLSWRDFLESRVLSRSTLSRYHTMVRGEVSDYALQRVAKYFGYGLPVEFRRYCQELLWESAWQAYETITAPRSKVLHLAIDTLYDDQNSKEEALQEALGDPKREEYFIDRYRQYLEDLGQEGTVPRLERIEYILEWGKDYEYEFIFSDEDKEEEDMTPDGWGFDEDFDWEPQKD